MDRCGRQGVQKLPNPSRTTPDGLSYARDIAARYGLNLQEICGQTEAKGRVSSLTGCMKFARKGG